MDRPRPSGLKPTLRQMMIVVLWAGLVTAATREAIRLGLLGDRPEMVCILVPIYFGVYLVPALMVLLWALDRPGRVRDWYGACCLVAGGVLGGTLLLLQDPACFVWSGRPTMTFPLSPFLGLGCLWGARKQWQLAAPRACPGCGRRSLITYAHPIRPGSWRRFNSGKFAWCAGCGATVDLDPPGAGI